MKAITFLLVAALTFVLAASAGYAADEKTDKTKKNSELIVGKWMPTIGAEKATIEFTKDGKINVTGEEGGKQVMRSGTYKFIDDKTFEVTIGERPRKVTIKSISASEMVTIDDGGKGKEEKFKAVK
jgi:uncharacterized protein (TIGR03066 family)